MNKKTRLFAAISSAVLLCCVTFSQEPVQNIDKKIHPNLAEAQRLVAEANHYIQVAAKDNHYDMSGHAGKAMQHLAEANLELKAAAEATDRVNAEKHH